MPAKYGSVYETRNTPKPGPDGGDIQRQAQQPVVSNAPRTGLPPGPSPYETMRDDAIGQYKSADLGYSPYMTHGGGTISGMDFDPYRQSAMNQADAGANQNYSSMQSQLQQMGDLSQADRIQAINKFNQDKIAGQLGARGKYDGLQSQNQFDVGKFNNSRGLDVQKQNIGAQNEANRDIAQNNLRRDENLWTGGVSERNLQRQLAAAKIIGDNQARGGSSGPLDFIFKPLSNLFS